MVLLPERYAARSVVMVEPAWAAVSYRDDELAISIHASAESQAVLSPEEVAAIPPAADRVRGVEARVTLNEQIRGVSWTEGEVAYSLEVECSRPMEDVRCTETAFVLQLANELVPAPRGAP
jgi:hypothetical protein